MTSLRDHRWNGIRRFLRIFDVRKLSLGNGRLGQLGYSHLARKIVLFNLIAMLVMGLGVVCFSFSRDSLSYQREKALMREIDLFVEIIGERMAHGDRYCPLSSLSVPDDADLYLFSAGGALICAMRGPITSHGNGAQAPDWATSVLGVINPFAEPKPLSIHALSIEKYRHAAESFAMVMSKAHMDAAVVATRLDTGDLIYFSVAKGIYRKSSPIAVAVLTASSGEVDLLARIEREQIFRMFLLALVVSVGLSLVLASTIATPLADLTRAAEMGRDHGAREIVRPRIDIPDMAGRRDDIGRLATAMQGMMVAFQDRIAVNEQFATDVTHELKNPLTSLRSAIDALQVIDRPEQKAVLLAIMASDVGRMDRLITDISRAARLDGDLVRAQKQSFDLIAMMRVVITLMRAEIEVKGVTLDVDLPDNVLLVTGLENRLMQVFQNVLANAAGFCTAGDKIGIIVTDEGDVVRVSIQDTGVGIPAYAHERIFERFYFDRPIDDFGQHSGLGLSIARQIVTAHGGRIWAEDVEHGTGARFVVVLPR